MKRMMMTSHEADDMQMISRCKAVILSTNSNLNPKRFVSNSVAVTPQNYVLVRKEDMLGLLDRKRQGTRTPLYAQIDINSHI